MQWPLPQDFNEAVQNPAAAFADPDLKGGRTVVGPLGLPLPASGNYADVYQVIGPDGRTWAVKCFTRPVFGLNVRYARVAEELARADLPFAVGFTFLADGIRVRGAWRPVIKMEWVEGRPLNEVVGENVGRPEVLASLLRVWVRLCRRLRHAGIAHGDIQHGNVLLIPGPRAGSYGLKLVDYDGMYVPALAPIPSGEAGHPNYQHPDRLATRAYSADLDRFPHLVVATALKGLEVLGPDLWGRYDNGDNLLFTEADFRAPAGSALMRELWQSGHPAVRALIGRLAIACGRPAAETPWLDRIVRDGDPVPLDPDAERAAAVVLNPQDLFRPAVPPPAPAIVTPVPDGPDGWETVEDGVEPPVIRDWQPEVEDGSWEPAGGEAEEPEPETEYDRPSAPTTRRPARRGRSRAWSPPRRRRSRRSSLLPVLAGGGTLVAVVVVVGVALVLAGDAPDTPTAQATTQDPREPAPRVPVTVPGGPGEPGGVSIFPNILPVPKLPEVKAFIPPPAPGTMVDVDFLPRLKVRWERPKGGVQPCMLAFTDDGKWLAVGAVARSELGVFNPVTGRPTALAFTGHVPRDRPRRVDNLDRVIGLAPMPGGEIISIAADQDFALVWDPETVRVKRTIPCPAIPAGFASGFLRASRDGRYFVYGATANDDWRPSRTPPPPVVVAEAETGRVVASIQLGWGAARFTMASTRLVAAHDRTGLIRVYRLDTGILESEARAVVGGDSTMAIAVSPDGKHAVFLSHAGAHDPEKTLVYVCDVATGRPVRTLPIPLAHPMRTDFSPDGKWLAVVKPANLLGHVDVILVDTATWAPVAVAPVGYSGRGTGDMNLRFSPDGTALAVPKTLGEMVVFDVPMDVSDLLAPAADPNSLWKHIELGRGEVVGDVVRLGPNARIRTRDNFSGPFEVSVVARTEKFNIRLNGPPLSEVIFNWELDPRQLRVHRPGPRLSIAAAPMVPLTPGAWYTLRWRLTHNEISVWVDDRLVFSERGRYDLTGSWPVQVRSIQHVVEVKSFTVTPVK